MLKFAFSALSCCTPSARGSAVTSVLLRAQHRSAGRMAAASTQVAVVGGGLAGSYCAHLLAKEGLHVTLFDMGRSGFGGRSSTRRSKDLQFDHGCQFILPSQQPVIQLLQQLQREGVAQAWEGRLGLLDAATGIFTKQSSTQQASGGGFCGVGAGGFRPWIGTPGMNAICRHLAAGPGIDARWNCQVTRVEQLPGHGWRVCGTQRSNDSDRTEEVAVEVDLFVLADLMTAIPNLPGSVDFGQASSLSLLDELRQPGKAPVFALMAAFKSSVTCLPFSAATVIGSDTFQWIARDSAKPGRGRQDGQECWVAVTTSAFAEQLLRDGVADTQSAAPVLTAAFTELLQKIADGVDIPELVSNSAQRWGSAFKTNLIPQRSLLDKQNALAACGDFCVESSAEGALLSARHAAQQITQFLSE